MALDWMLHFLLHVETLSLLTHWLPEHPYALPTMIPVYMSYDGLVYMTYGPS